MTSFVQIAHLTSIDCFRTIKYDSSLYAKQQQLSKWRPSPMFANNFMLFAQRIYLTPTLNCCAFSQPRRAVWIAGSLPSWHATCPTYGIHIAAYFGNWAWEIPMCRLACLPPSLSPSVCLFTNYLWVMLIWLWNECSKGETSKGNVQPVEKGMSTHQHVKY